ncbi:RHS repeat domain-containing protein [Zestomonas carbonaria]|uniref:Teneurin-like YD-shell domain-containing protein n=1 Tax=Zestomonas carbonaria TaxID=2762745 RepID=A0A7U7EJY5_9GAMM|nr:RHS repeat-associated core domain-containing protein [Pseudomonas carbonaria]CAD5106320.1 hypothetical protein PSEWESI4_00580 [Pseudomonas carbonaria]
MRIISWLFGAFILALGTTATAETLVYTTYYHNDHLGSPVAATDERGDLLWRAHFRPYGERQENPTDAAFGNVGYTGHTQDADSGLVYMQARYYDPIIGRFMAVDPVEVNPESTISFNRYAYANNNPHVFVDPNGESAVTAFGGLLHESGQFLMGNGFDGAMVAGALADGYNGDGSGFAAAAFEDATSFIPAGAVSGGVIKLGRLVKSSKALKGTGKEVGILRDAAKGKGNFGLGSGTRAEADKLGKAWVGDGYKVASDGKALVSKDGLRQYRPPSYKPRQDKTQANFEQRFPGQQSRQWQSNGHLDITD